MSPHFICEVTSWKYVYVYSQLDCKVRNINRFNNVSMIANLIDTMPLFYPIKSSWILCIPSKCMAHRHFCMSGFNTSFTLVTYIIRIHDVRP